MRERFFDILMILSTLEGCREGGQIKNYMPGPMNLTPLGLYGKIGTL